MSLLSISKWTLRLREKGLSDTCVWRDKCAIASMRTGFIPPRSSQNSPPTATPKTTIPLHLTPATVAPRRRSSRAEPLASATRTPRRASWSVEMNARVGDNAVLRDRLSSYPYPFPVDWSFCLKTLFRLSSHPYPSYCIIYPISSCDMIRVLDGGPPHNGS